MSVRLGTVTEGRPYAIEFDAAAGNLGNSYVFVGWVPAGGHAPQAFPLRVQAGQTGRHQKPAPSANNYYLVEIRVDVPEPGQGTLTVRGLDEGEQVVEVEEDEVYWVEISPA